MTAPLATLFENKEIRAIEQDGDIIFPLADLASAWGVHRNTLPDIIDRHPDRFEGFHTTAAHETCAGLRAVNEAGLYLLIGAISTDRLKNPAAAEAILRFQRWVPQLIKKYRKGEISQQAPAEDPLIVSLKRNADIADILIERYGFKPDDAHDRAMRAVVKDVGEPALVYRGLPELAVEAPLALPSSTAPPSQLCIQCSFMEADPDFDKYYSLRDVAKFTRQTETRAQEILTKEGLMTWANGHYRPTTLALKDKLFAKIFITKPQWPHRPLFEQTNTRWSPAAIERIKVHLNIGQTSLTAQAQPG